MSKTVPDTNSTATGMPAAAGRAENPKGLRQRLDREQLIRSIIELGSRSMDLAAVLETAAGEVGRFFGVDRCVIVRFSDQEGYNAKACGQFCVSADVVPIEISDLARSARGTKELAPDWQ